MAGSRRIRARPIIAWASSLVVVAAFIGGVVIAKPYDTEDLPALETNVWVARDFSGGQYARFNTDVDEIQTVNDAKSGVGGVLQSGSAAFVLGSNDAKYWPIDSANPADIGGDAGNGTSAGGAAQPADAGGPAADGIANPSGGGDIVTAGQYVLFEGTTPSWARAAELGGTTPPVDRLDPYAAMAPPAGASQYSATASTISRDGVVAMYSSQSQERRIVLYDTVRGAWSTETINDPPDATTEVQLTMVGDKWVMLALGNDPRLWVSGHKDPFDLAQVVQPTTSPLLQGPGAASDVAVIATSSGVEEIGLDDGSDAHVAASGTAARPEALGDQIAAGWITPSGAAVWTSDMPAARTDLQIDSSQFADNITPDPVIATNGDRAVLVEQATGMLWTLPDGKYIPMEAWTAGEPPPQAGQVVVTTAKQEEPPVAEADAFGVRAGATATLPVLDNDHDANAGDVLSIDQSSIRGLDPAFGTLELSADDQQLVVHVTGAVPSATFSYAVSDGIASSAPATVTLTLQDGESPPQWCGELVQPSCLIDWPTPQIAIGGTATFDVLRGWIDPEGDAIAIASAVPSDPRIVAMPTADGRLAIGDTDPSGAAGDFTVMVTVMDSRGGISAPKALEVAVEGTPGFNLRGGIVVGTAGATSVAEVDDYASGGSGAFQISDAVDISPTLGRLRIDKNPAKGTISLEADEPGEYVLTMTVKDAVTQTQATANLRFSVTALDPGGISIPPLTAFVRTGQDTLIDVLGAVGNTTGKALLVTGATPDTGSIAAAVSDASAVQLRTTDPKLAPGPVGSVRVDLADADGNSYAAQVSVFLIAPSSGDGPIAVPDAATVRAGQVIDIPVLANDIAPYGERLSLHPDVDAPNAPADALAFASGNVLRYRAPESAGTYLVYYTAYLDSNPGKLSRSQVAIQVLPAGSNRAPQAVDITARGAAGRAITIPVDTNDLDPDGDPVVVSAVTQPGDPTLGAVQIGQDGKSLVYYAPEPNAQQPVAGWQASFTYTVKDTAGLTSTANVNVVVTTRDLGDEAPLVFSDHYRVQQIAEGGAPQELTVEPLLNDRDPGAEAVDSSGSGSGLHILYAVAPDASGDPADPSSQAGLWAALIEPSTSTTKGLGTATTEVYPDGEVHFRITAATLPGTYLYLYTVESLRTLSTSQGLIVITVSPGDAPDVPTIDDTVVTAQDRDQVVNGGIDVLSGKVTWPTGGDAQSLQALSATLELAPGAPAGFSVRSGTGRITGPRLPDGGAIVPFDVRGKDAAGKDFVAYGLLRIPAIDDFRLTVVTPPAAIQETTTGDIDLQTILGVGQDDRVEVSPDSTFATHRPTSDQDDPTSCELKPGTTATLEYHASYFPGNASDTCTIIARIAGQSDAAWTALVIPITIAPLDPLAILTPTTRTISIVTGPETFDLYDMLVTWTGGAQGPKADPTTMRFSWAYSGDAFGVSPASGTASSNADHSNGMLTVKASADARAGTRETLKVTLSYPYVPRPGRPTPAPYSQSVTIVLVVGMAPSQGPSGASLSLACSARDQPTGCDVLAVLPGDTQGQFNPITAANASGDVSLRLTGLGGGSAQTADCASLASATIQGDRVKFSWLPAEGDKFPGGTCTVPFTVVDRQGRTGQGQIVFNASGYPAKPNAPVTTAYTADSVTLDVVLGDAANAHPDLSGVKLYDADTGVEMPSSSCAKSSVGAYRCTVTGLVNGQVRHIAATAVNQVGESVMTSAVTTNAYLAPAFDPGEPSYDDQVYVAGTTNGSQGVIEVSACAQNGVQRIRFQSGSFTQEVSTGGGDCIPAGTRLTLPVGAQSIAATPISQYAPPQVGTVAGVNTGSSATATVNVRGRASFTTQPTLSTDAAATQLAVHFQLDSGDGVASGPAGDGTRGGTSLHVLAWLESDPAPSCTAADTPAGAGGGLAVSGGGGSLVDHALSSTVTSDVFPIGAGGLAPNETYDVKVCASYGYGLAQSSVASAILFRKPAAPTSTDLTYTSAARPSTMAAYYTGVTAPADGAAFSWDVPDTAPTNDAAADFASQMAGLDPAPGTGWQVRYATSPGGPYTGSSIDGNTGTWYAEFCFTDGGTDYCSGHSAGITSKYGSVGIAFGSTGTVTLPAAATCQALVDGVNAQIASAGDAAVAAARQSWAEGFRQGGYNGTGGYQPTYDALFPTATQDYLTDHYEPGDNTSGYDATLIDKYLNGYSNGSGTYTGFTAAHDAYLAANPGDDAGAVEAGRAAGVPGATAYATDQATAAGQAAVNAAYADFDEAADAPTARADGESTVFQSANPAAPAIAVNGFTTTPFTGGAGVADEDTGTRRFTGFHYDLSTISATTANLQYVVDQIQSVYPTAITCG